mmetsp:Transcript_11679/g.24410  ORF Transcript_11679/g.24410 Transcript_11679/m.24410 type:complete len:87 (+) Transcript_11679:797-1057(+)
MTRTLSMAADANDQVRRDPPCAVTGADLSQTAIKSEGPAPPPRIAAFILSVASEILEAALAGDASKLVLNAFGASGTKAAVRETPT